MRPVLLLVLIVTAAVLQPAAAQRPMPRPRPGPEIPPATPVRGLRPAPRGEAPRVPSWFSFGLGPSTALPRGRGMAHGGVRLVVPLGLGSAVVDAGATVVFESALLSLNPFAGNGQGESVTVAHVAGGLAGRHGAFVGSVAAGPAIVRVNTLESALGRDRLVGQTYPGAYASAQAVAALGRTVGLGAEAFGVLNEGHPTGGLRLFVAVGALR